MAGRLTLGSEKNKGGVAPVEGFLYVSSTVVNPFHGLVKPVAPPW